MLEISYFDNHFVYFDFLLENIYLLFIALKKSKFKRLEMEQQIPFIRSKSLKIADKFCVIL